ncbi:MAG TPA: sensor histidine kinase [Gaiellaceae bacterium]|nr:sensor histidine kinase [Gaiellaceae bacterium]
MRKRIHLGGRRPDPVRIDRGLALVLLAAAELQIWLSGAAGGHRFVAAATAPVLAACVAVRRRYPLLAGVVAQGTVAFAFAFWSDTEIFGTSIAWFCALYAMTVWTSPRRFAAGAVFVAVSNVAAAAGPVATLQKTVPFSVVTLIVMVLVRRVVGDRERRAQLAERERDVAAREAVVEERARIARELHDAIAHNVSMMVVQAGAERRTLEPDRGTTRDVLATIEQIGRGALTEMRRLVGMLRSEAGDPLAPQPGLDDLELLVAQVREAGLPVELQVKGEHRELPVGLELSAYRIVQEALTNALKHAGDARATVRVSYSPDTLELEIVDDGAGGPTSASNGGHGLVGMRERVALYGGRLDAGGVPSGGFAIRVLLPIR